MPRLASALIALVLLALAPAAHAQQRVGEWVVIENPMHCMGLRVDRASGVTVSLIHPKASAPAQDFRMFVVSTAYFGEIEDKKPVPAHLVLTSGASFDTRWQDQAALGVVLKTTGNGIFISGMKADFVEAFAAADGLRIEMQGKGALEVELAGTRDLTEALRKCAVPQG